MKGLFSLKGFWIWIKKWFLGLGWLTTLVLRAGFFVTPGGATFLAFPEIVCGEKPPVCAYRRSALVYCQGQFPEAGRARICWVRHKDEIKFLKKPKDPAT